MPADHAHSPLVKQERAHALRSPGSTGGTRRTLALLACALLLALTGAGCGSDQPASEQSLPDRPKLTVPDGSVEADKSKSSEATGETGSTDSGTSTGTDTTTNSGGAGTGGTTGGQGTGGQGTGQDQTTTPQDTGGAAPGN
jgi:hypothetical protein